MTPSLEPFKVAGAGLNELLSMSRESGQLTVVTVLTPIKYELQCSPVPRADQHMANTEAGQDRSTDCYSRPHEYGVGGRLVGSLLTSLEDPVLSKWIFVALVSSVVLNSYLFKAARLGIEDPNLSDHSVNRNEPPQGEKFNAAHTLSLPLQSSSQVLQSSCLTSDNTDNVGEASLASMTIPTKVTVREKASATTQKAPVPSIQVGLKETPISELHDEDVVALSLRGNLPGYAREKSLKNCTRAVKVRRSIISRTPATAELTSRLEDSELPYENYAWERVLGACCENVIGFMPVPVGVAGPIVIDGRNYFIPMATDEGILVASASRGSKAINLGGGAVTILTSDGMTRGPCVSFEILERAGAAKTWLDSDVGQNVMKEAFNSTSRFARL